MQTPYFLVHEDKLRQNLAILQAVKAQTGCKILLAQKAFSMYATYPLIAEYLDGTTSSGLFEARLAHEEFGGEGHVYSPAFTRHEFEAVLPYVDHFVFNSPNQFRQFGDQAKAAGKSIGIRINPEFSTQEGHAIYDPCSPGSRLGTTRAGLDLTETELELLDGLHFHTLCEQNSDDLVATVAAVEAKFGDLLPGLKWLNFGGGHHITRPDYDILALVAVVNRIQDQYDLTVYLEPGEAVALNAGELVTSVIDFNENSGIVNAILDTSATCHMPDVLEMPYRPPLLNSGAAGELAYTYRLGGPTCLAGDIIGDYSFASPLTPGAELRFQDMAIYTMVKTNTFNGMPLPAIVWQGADGSQQVIREFGYADFKQRL